MIGVQKSILLFVIGIIDYNFLCFREAIQQVFELRNKNQGFIAPSMNHHSNIINSQSAIVNSETQNATSNSAAVQNWSYKDEPVTLLSRAEQCKWIPVACSMTENCKYKFHLKKLIWNVVMLRWVILFWLLWKICYVFMFGNHAQSEFETYLTLYFHVSSAVVQILTRGALKCRICTCRMRDILTFILVYIFCVGNIFIFLGFHNHYNLRCRSMFCDEAVIFQSILPHLKAVFLMASLRC